ncbi:flavin reductase family protein [Kitasatospora mediocidica]|uniref:flavin reductase family protein n=1 Tax=Kitasatospora mediocidica TaxID=58352 RepID=UPI00068FC8E1|nr:flavin reductase family protein [Kitasatospora mediocidica]
MSTAAEPRTGPAGRFVSDRSEHRRALKQLASPVSILTVRHGDRLHGTTVSTVTTVSQSPLILGACLKGGSILAELAVAEGRFAVNVLGGEQGQTARWFADSSRPDGIEQFDGIGWRAADYAAAPLLDGALAHYDCRVVACYRVGDHEVLLGAVVHATAVDGAPLLSFAGGLFAGPLPPAAAAGTDSTRTRKENAAL